MPSWFTIFDSDRWAEIFQTLSRNKLRTFLTAFGVFWGIFMLIIMLGAGNGLQKGAMSNFGDRAVNSVFIWSRSTSKAYNGFAVGRRVSFRNADVEAIRREVPEIEYLAPRNQLGGFRGTNTVVRKLESANFNIYGDYPEIKKIDPVKIKQGRFLNPMDLEQKRKICIIGERVRQVLFKPDENPIGDYIRISGVYFMVVGVFESYDPANIDDTETIYIPFTTFQQAFNYGDRIGWLALTSKPEFSGALVEEKVKTVLRKRHQVHPEDNRAFGSFNLQEEFQKFSGLFNGIRIITWFVGSLTLLAGVIGVSNIMLVIIKERTREIGVRRALGATPFTIIAQILLESITLTALAGYGGVLLGIGLLELVGSFMEGSDAGFFAAPSVDINIVLIALFILVLGGTLAGLIPASRAIRIKPVEALRTE